MTESKQNNGNALVTGAVIAGAAVAAAVLSKKENRDKAKKMVTTAIRDGKKLMKNPVAKTVAGVVVSKVVDDARDSIASKIGEPNDTKKKIVAAKK